MRPVKREPSGGNRKRKESGSADSEEQQQFRAKKRERMSRNRVEEEPRDSPESTQAESDRRVLRSSYLAVKSFLKDERDDLLRPNSDKFSSIIDKVENLHQQVQKPREQVADAEALLGIASTLVTSVKSQSSEGITPADLLSCLLEEFGETSLENEQVSIRWKDLGLALSSTFRTFYGCCTMLGPMNTELKQRKVPVRRSRTAKGPSVRPEELDDPAVQEKTDTDRNMAIMFDILRRKRRVRQDHLILNRASFAQTVENQFALSFLVKDGRAEITVDENCVPFVSPKNAPAAGTVGYNHYVFRFDFKDWKVMADTVPVGEELMPHRGPSAHSTNATESVGASDSRAGMPTTPIRKLSRNRGLVIQEESVVEDSPEINNDDDSGREGAAIRKCKRKLQ